jgi:flagellar biosynthesis protein
MFTRRIRREKAGYRKDPPIQRAVALGYNPEKDNTPRVLASGQGILAEQIIAIARENGVAIRDDPALAAALASVDLGETIPPELYALVAEVLAFVYHLKEKAALK